MEEIWKDVPGYEGFYKVSNTGKVLSTIKNIIMRPHKNNGYERVELHKNGKFFKFFVHRLVAQAFIPNSDNKPVVDHINTIRDDNNVSNLRWVSVSENINNENTLKKHRTPHTKEWCENIKDSLSKQPIICVETGKIYKSQMEASRITGIPQPNIHKVIKGKRNTAGGYHWKELQN